jgi:adenylate cyclase
MTAASPKRQTLDARETTIDVVVETADTPSDNQGHQPKPNSSSALATTKGNFSAYLAPLNQDTFKQVVNGVEDKLVVMNQTLSMLDDILSSQGFDGILDEMLQSISLKTGELLGADRTTIFLLDEEKQQLWSIVAKGSGGGSFEIRINADQGIAGEVATYKRVVNIPYDFFDDPRSGAAKVQYEKTGYRTYTMLCLPLVGEDGKLVAVVQLLNKLKKDNDPASELDQRIDYTGFTQADEALFADFAPSIRLILESSRSLRKATQRQRAAEALMTATQSLSQSSLDLEETLGKVMDEAKKLMGADRSTLWLIDKEAGQLWTKIPIAGELREIRIPLGAGFAGQVATSGEPLNIGFDLYDHPNSQTSKDTDKRSGYRTCSMLCMPVKNGDGELIAVTQLINKLKQGEYPPYDPESWPTAPDCWKAGFDRSDQEFMEAFNIQAGVALQNAKLFATIKQQEQMQRDILRSLSDGVISTAKDGKIIAANEKAKELLGLKVQDKIEGRLVAELVWVKEKQDKNNAEKNPNKFVRWFQDALNPQEEKNREQYYPDQILQSTGTEQHSVNISINTIADATDAARVNGALVIMEDISDEKRLKTTMYRYMNQDLAEQLISGGEAMLGGDLKDVSVLFSDIRSYTTLTEKMSPEDVVSMLNEYFEDMVDALFSYKGTLDKYIGDAMMAVFGSPLPLDDHQWMAVQTAVEMRKRLILFNDKRVVEGHIPISIGIGIHSDKVLGGNIGSSRRMEYTAIGDGVNLASRLEGASKQYGCDIVISEQTYHPCASRIWARELDYIKVKGKTQPVSVYELVGLQDEPVPEQKLRVLDHYAKGLDLYRKRQFARAIGEFATVAEIDQKDKSAGLHMVRCQHWLTNPPPDDWDGSWIMTEK